jgi:hypothetical protein
MYAYYPIFNEDCYSHKQRRERLNKVIFDYSKLYFAEKNWSDRLNFDKMQAEFWKRIRSSELQDIGKVLDAQIQSFKSVTHSDWSKIKAEVIKETSIEIYAAFLLTRFESSKFVHLIRDPRDNYAALKAGLNKRYKDFPDDANTILSSLIHRYGLGMRLAEFNQRRFGNERYIIVRHEDVTANTKKTLMGICDFLNISFHPKLLQPSVLGKPTKGNNFEDIVMTSVSTVNVGRWKARITETEAKIIEFYFKDLMAKYGYECEYDSNEQIDAASEFYKWANYKYYYFDHFANINSN